MSVVKRMATTAICAAMCVVLPLAFHTIRNAGTVFLPMHIPVLLCGLVCGWPYGLLTGLLGPLLSSVITGMPPAAMLPSMMVECATYGLVTGLMMLFVRTKHMTADLYISMITAMIVGRTVSGLSKALIFTPGTAPFAWVTTSLVTGIPGIVIQLVLMPLLIFTLTLVFSLPLGLAVTAHLQKSMHATESSPGRVHLELTAAAVLVDEGGVIRGCAIDGVRATVPFDQGGTPLLYPGTAFPSKCALGEDYGMARASSLGQEWDTQAARLAADCIGKTAAQLLGGDVTTSVTIAAADALYAVAEAAENAVACDAAETDPLALTCAALLTDAAAPTAEQIALGWADASGITAAGYALWALNHWFWKGADAAVAKMKN